MKHSNTEIKNLEKAHLEIKEAFIKYANSKSLFPAQIDEALRMIEKVVEDKKLCYYMNQKVDKLNNKIEHFLDNSITTNTRKNYYDI